MPKPRASALIVGIFAVVASSLYLGHIIQDGSSPLAILSPRAAGGDSERLIAQNILSPSATVTPTTGYTSTSPTQALSPTVSAVSATLPPSETPSPTIEIQPTIISSTPSVSPGNLQEVIYVSATPSVPISTLPVAGFSNYIPRILLGGGALLILGMLL